MAASNESKGMRSTLGGPEIPLKGGGEKFCCEKVRGLVAEFLIYI
jgi:hypothetical protein